MSLPGSCGPSKDSLRPAGSLSLAAQPGVRPAVSPFSLVDLQARKVEYLRVSVTDRCNYRCTYCMPAEGVQVVPRPELLTYAELERLVRLFVGLGVRRVRITGGEPLVRRDIVELVRRLAAIEGVEDLSMTTNGHLLREYAGPLREAGLQRLNVSLDTLRPKRFVELTRRGGLAHVLDGLTAARAAGFQHTKINAVMLRGLNDDEIVDLADFSAAGGYVLRYIEYMPIGVDDFWGPETFLPVDEVRRALAMAWDLDPDLADRPPGGGPARYWLGRRRSRPDLPPLQLGFISAVSENFCRLCNRVRLSSTGTLRECLSARGSLSLRDRMRAGGTDAELLASIRDALLGKVDGHRFDDAIATPEAMSSIGG